MLKIDAPERRSKICVYVGKRWPATIAIALAVGLVVYARYVEPNWLQVSNTKIGNVADQKVLVVVQISDLHLQEVAALERSVIQRVREIQPDLLVLSGDVIDKPESLPQLDQFLSGLIAIHKVAVLGNWEYWSDVDLVRLREVYRSHNVELLVNETVNYTVKGRTLAVHGIDDYTAGNPRIHLKKGPSTETSVLVQHSPGYFEENRNELAKVTLCLSGHTHGGQITAFGWPIWKPQGSGKFASGLYDTATCPLYVSRGIGTSILNFRFGARPEIAVFTI
jgi:predicted MPP superfamily phosphohydrolase